MVIIIVFLSIFLLHIVSRGLSECLPHDFDVQSHEDDTRSGGFRMLHDPYKEFGEWDGEISSGGL
jgi:hypothetical protein